MHFLRASACSTPREARTLTVIASIWDGRTSPRDESMRKTRRSSISFGRRIGVVFMRVNSKCAHQVRPPLADLDGCRSPVAPL
jgi:hypothetical protein